MLRHTDETSIKIILGFQSWTPTAVWTKLLGYLIYQHQQNGIWQVPLSYKKGYWAGMAEHLGEDQSLYIRT